MKTTFLPFLTHIGQTFGPKHPSNMIFLAIFALNFHTGVSTTTTFCFNRYSPCKIQKKPIDNDYFFTFFTTLGLIWPRSHTLIFFAAFQWGLLGDFQNYWIPIKVIQISWIRIQLIWITLIGIQYGSSEKFFC